MTPVRHVVYLHGFASLPASSKAQRFSRELVARGVGFDCPDLNEPSFETLTISRMLGQLKAAVARARSGPIAIVGSSLGGFVAINASSDEEIRAAGVDRLVLLAPAVDFGGRFRDKTFASLQRIGEHGIDEWRRTGRLEVFHYAANEPRHLGFGLYEDAAQYDAFDVPISLPTLVFQGRRDESVDPQSVERWAATRPLVNLRLLDDDHQLAASMDAIWNESRSFLGLT
jgi:alpha-beta hydrolase superfamily lysophospholipase